MIDADEVRQLPLNAIRTFHAVVRAGRFRAAAEALGVTESAVSHQIKRLERFLGASLLERQGREMQLTALGARYHAGVARALGELARATGEIVGRGSRARVTLTLPTSLAAFWLIPRMGALQQKQPEINLQILTTNRLCDFAHENIDLGIRYGLGRWPGFESRRLLSEQFFPVASGTFLAHHKRRDPARLLREAPVIANALHPGEWEEWCEAYGLPAPPADRRLTLESSELVLQAAVEGVGLAIGRRPMVDRLVADKTLKAPFAQETRSAAGYYLVRPKAATSTRAARLVERWLMEEAQASSR